MFERGQPATALWVVVEGVVRGFEEIGGEWLLVATTKPGEVTGMLPYSRMTHYPRHTVAAEPSVVLRLDTAHFREMADASHEVMRRLVAQMSDRVRRDARLEQQTDKMMALGRLSAGLAHEINNPAAAIRRASSRLAEHRAGLPTLVLALAGHGLGHEALEKLGGIRASAGASDMSLAGELERSEQEEELSGWLEDIGVDRSWEMAATLVESGVTVGDLTGMADLVPRAALGDVLAWLSGGIESDRLVAEINTAAGRVSDLVTSVKTYSQMDRSREHKPTDVRIGLDNTLTMMGHELRQKQIRVTRDYPDDVPMVPANEGELNQVWTNLIDNAIDAVFEGGAISLRVRTSDVWLEVEVLDDGPGIPDEIQRRIFEPFFTTKGVGVGTGLGLGIAQLIVRTHQGHIEVRSQPGETVMCVRLPMDRPSPVGEAPSSMDDSAT
jgi:signal transduction histidine kinase